MPMPRAGRHQESSGSLPRPDSGQGSTQEEAFELTLGSDLGGGSAAQRTGFAQLLSQATAAAPQHVAMKLMEQLQRSCLEAAGIGRTYLVWEAPLPPGRSFSNAVARTFAGQLTSVGFSRLEWWNGKEWREMPGRYCVLHDNVYDKYHLRIRITWPEASDDITLPAEIPKAPSNMQITGLPDLAGSAAQDKALEPVLRQLQQIVTLEQKLLIQSATALAEAEERARQAEERAVNAEQSCLRFAEQSRQRRVALEQRDAKGGGTPELPEQDMHWRELCGL